MKWVSWVWGLFDRVHLCEARMKELKLAKAALRVKACKENLKVALKMQEFANARAYKKFESKL